MRRYKRCYRKKVKRRKYKKQRGRGFASALRSVGKSIARNAPKMAKRVGKAALRNAVKSGPKAIKYIGKQGLKTGVDAATQTLVQRMLQSESQVA